MMCGVRFLGDRKLCRVAIGHHVAMLAATGGRCPPYYADQAQILVMFGGADILVGLVARFSCVVECGHYANALEMCQLTLRSDLAALDCRTPVSVAAKAGEKRRKQSSISTLVGQCPLPYKHHLADKNVCPTVVREDHSGKYSIRFSRSAGS
jgi:hypothetical protein